MEHVLELDARGDGLEDRLLAFEQEVRVRRATARSRG
jgi:hypothetical protein